MKAVSGYAAMSDQAKTWSRESWRERLTEAIGREEPHVTIRQSMVNHMIRELNHARKGSNPQERADYVHAILLAMIGEGGNRDEVFIKEIKR